MAWNHIAFCFRTDRRCNQCTDCRDHTINDNGYPKGCAADKETCNGCNIKSTHFGHHINSVFRIWLMQRNCLTDGIDFPVQSFRGKSGSTSGHIFYRSSKNHGSNCTAGRGISDSHFSGCNDPVSLFFQGFYHLNPGFDCLNRLFSCHSRLFYHIFCSICDLPVQDADICGNSHIDRKNLCAYSLTHDTGDCFCLQKILAHQCCDFLSSLCHSFFYHTIICTHGNKGFLFQIHPDVSCDSGNLHQHIFQLSKTVKRMGNAVPLLSALFHSRLIQRPDFL